MSARGTATPPSGGGTRPVFGQRAWASDSQEAYGSGMTCPGIGQDKRQRAAPATCGVVVLITGNARPRRTLICQSMDIQNEGRRSVPPPLRCHAGGHVLDHKNV
jgi:hypothetical protein